MWRWKRTILMMVVSWVMFLFLDPLYGIFSICILSNFEIYNRWVKCEESYRKTLKG